MELDFAGIGWGWIRTLWGLEWAVWGQGEDGDEVCGNEQGWV